MATLSIRTALTQIERALQTTILLGLQKRAAAVGSIAALRLVASRTPDGGNPYLHQFAAQPVTSPLSVWLWSPLDARADNGTTIVKPTDVDSALPGRWTIATHPQLFAPSPETSPIPVRLDVIQAGYLNRVILWTGEWRKKEFEERILAHRPCVAIVWNASEHDQRSTLQGNIYHYPARFEILCCSANLRADQEAMHGGGTAADTAADPGAVRILGDVKQLLADANKWDPMLAQAGITRVVLGEEDVADVDLVERKAIVSLGVVVEATVMNVDAAAELTAVESIEVQQKLTHLNAAETFDPLNHVVSGYRVLAGFGLTATPSAGSAVVGGAAVSSTPAAHTFGEHADTYRDLAADGTFTYVAVPAGTDPPPVTASCLRVAVTTTSATSVLVDRFLAAVSANFGEAFPIPKP